MRFTIIIFIAILIISMSNTLIAQEQERLGNLIVVVTYERVYPEDGSNAEFDSLNQLWTAKVIMKNEYIINRQEARHMYGSNSSDYVVIQTYKTFTDIEKARKRNGELFRETWSTKEARKEYSDAAGKYWGDHHSDEIYREIKSGRK